MGHGRHKLESLWYKQTAQNTLTQIFAKNWTHPSLDYLCHKFLVCAGSAQTKNSRYNLSK